jgi:hypothetical protein
MEALGLSVVTSRHRFLYPGFLVALVCDDPRAVCRVHFCQILDGFRARQIELCMTVQCEQ